MLLFCGALDCRMAELTQYVTLGVADEVFAVPVGKVQEILDLRPIARLPRAPNYLLGMIDVRGSSVPVLDLRLTLDMPASADTETSRILVLSVEGPNGGMTVGLKTDRVFEVTVLDDDTLDPAPAVNSGWSDHGIAGVGRRNGQFVIVLDLDRLLKKEVTLASSAL
jgi:purine-binding chemotaxis protein CheW